MSIKVKVGGSRSIRAVPKQDTNRPIVAQGQSKAVISPDSVVLGIDTIGAYLRSVDAGDGIVIVPELNTESANVVIRHANTSTAVSTTNDPLDFVTNVNIDNFGHITSFGNSTFWSYNFYADGNNIRAKDLTIGNTSFTIGESINFIEGLVSLNAGDITITQDRISSLDDVILSPRPGGVVDVDTSRIINLTDPVNEGDAVNRQYLDQQLEDVAASLLIFSDPVNPTDPANKRYVDKLEVNTLQKLTAYVATTGDLGATYAQGNNQSYSGNTAFGDTLTIDPGLLILDIDGHTNWDLGDSVLVKDQTNALENGRYELTQRGDGISAWIFKRSILSDEASEIASLPIFVSYGNTYGNTGWISQVSNAKTFELGTDPITFKQFQGTGFDGRGITLTDGTRLDLDYTQEFQQITGKDDNLIISSNIVDVNSNGALILPDGTSAERPTAERGMVRFNSTDSQFEGYDGQAWQGLGGVIDVDQDTYVIAESSPGADNDQIDVYTNGVHAIRVDSNGITQFLEGLRIDGLTEQRITFAGANGKLSDSNNLIFDGTTLTVKGNTDITGNLTLGGNIQIGNANVDSIEVVADFTSNLIPNQHNTFDIGTIGKNWNRLFVDDIKSDDGIVNIATTGGLKLPIGSTGDRPADETGLIRFNTTDSRFEGYDGSIWSGLAGSVQDIDQDTKIVAETSPGADNDQLEFYTGGTKRFQVDSNGDVGFGSDYQKVIINYTTGDLNVNTKITSNADLFLEANGAVNASGTKITNVADPTANTDVVTYNYLENGSFQRTLTFTENANTYEMDLLSGNSIIDIGLGLDVTSFENNRLAFRLAPSGAEAGRYGNDGYSARVTVDAFGRVISATEVPLVLQSNAIVEFEEASQDITADQFRFGTHAGISYTYDDASSNGFINSTVDNFVLTLGGEVSGSNTVVSVSDTVIPVTITTDYVLDVQGEANNSIEVFHSTGNKSTAIIKHGNTSSVNDAAYINGQVINNIGFDEYGHVISHNYVDLDTRYLQLSGGVLTGNITAGRFIDADDTQYYADPAGISLLNRAVFGHGGSNSRVDFRDGAGTVSIMYGFAGKVGFLNNSFNFASYSERATGNWVVPGGDVIAERFVDVDNQSYFAHPAGTIAAGTVSKFYDFDIENTLAVTGNISINSLLNITEDTITADAELYLDSNDGLINVLNNKIQAVGDPTDAQDAANKRYVDGVAQGLRIIPSALAATVGSNLPSTYNSSSGTLTATSTGAFTLDGVTLWSQGDKVLVKDQTNAYENGSYELTTVGSVSTNWVLTRDAYFDEASEIPGSFQFITDGTVNSGSGYVAVVADAETFILGQDITYYQFSGAGTYTAGSGLTLTGTEFKITNPFIDITGESGGTDRVTLGQTINLAGGEGIDTNVSNNTITIAGEIATDSNIGMASFAAANFSIAGGQVAVAVIDGGTF